MHVTVGRALDRHSAIGLTRAKQDDVTRLARRFGAARRAYISEFWSARYCADILRRARGLADERRKRGWPDNGLSAHQNRVALLSVLAMLKGSWAVAIRGTDDYITASDKLTGTERRWMRYVLRTPMLLQACLDGGIPRVDKPWASDLDAPRLARRIRRHVERRRGTRPTDRRLWFDLDTNLYDVTYRRSRRFHGAWLSLTVNGDGRRRRIPLSGSDVALFAPRTDRLNSRPGLRADIIDGRLRLRAFERLTIATREGGVDAGVDIGYRATVTVSRGDAAASFGENLPALIRETVAQHERRRRNRTLLEAYERSMRNNDAAKARRIRRSNLRKRRQLRAARRETLRLREAIGAALNRLFESIPDVSRLHIEGVDFRGRRRPRRTTRLLRRWQYAYLIRHLVLKAQLHGVQLNVVNPAWTSLTCPRCGYLSTENRRAESFDCGSCGYTGSADAVAATNILRRGSDPGITRFMRSTAVKQILEERWRSARSGRAWGSAPACDTAAGASREHDVGKTSPIAPVPFSVAPATQPSPQ